MYYGGHVKTGKENASTDSTRDSCDRHLRPPITMPLAGDSIKTSASMEKQ